METTSDSEARPQNFTALPPFYRVYKPQTQGSLHTQLGNYHIFYTHGGHGLLLDHVRLAYAVNELAATTLGLGKLYLLNLPPKTQPTCNSPHPIPDLLFVPAYKWTEEARDTFLSRKPADRLPQMTASLPNQHPAEPTLPVFVFPDQNAPYVRPDGSLKLQHPPLPDKGVWIWTTAQPFRAGSVHDIAKIGIIYCPYDSNGERLNYIIRRLDEACEVHHAYLTKKAVGGNDQVVSVYHWLQVAAMNCSVLQMEMWGKIVRMVNEAFEPTNGGVAHG